VREDDKRRDLLFAGTELGVFVSWNGGKDWAPFQLNLPVTPITDLKIHQSDLIAATSGRSFWILDDLSLVRQYKGGESTFALFQPEPTVLASAYSELDKSDPEFNGTNPYRGVNPATGSVIYYQLPELKENEHILLEIKDSKGNLVRSFSSKADTTFHHYDGGPNADPTLTKTKGVNRFVWNLRYPTMVGVTNVFVENSFSGHKASPGKYVATLKYNDKTVNTELEILSNPVYSITAKHYEEYHQLMSALEAEQNKMSKMVTLLYNKMEQLNQLLANLPAEEKFSSLRANGLALTKRMKLWDEDMVQRKSKAYDDMENFPNKFITNYMFMINHAESDIPKVTQSTLGRQKELNAEWANLEARVKQILEKDLPGFNKQLWEAGIGAVWSK
jgi:hypothetical protein